MVSGSPKCCLIAELSAIGFDHHGMTWQHCLVHDVSCVLPSDTHLADGLDLEAQLASLKFKHNQHHKIVWP